MVAIIGPSQKKYRIRFNLVDYIIETQPYVLTSLLFASSGLHSVVYLIPEGKKTLNDADGVFSVRVQSDALCEVLHNSKTSEDILRTSDALVKFILFLRKRC